MQRGHWQLLPRHHPALLRGARRTTALKTLAEVWPCSLALPQLPWPGRGELRSAAQVRGVKEILNPQRRVCCRWLVFQHWGLSRFLTRQQIGAAMLGNAQKCLLQSGSSSCCSSSLRQAVFLFWTVVVLKRFSNKEALLWSLQHCF